MDTDAPFAPALDDGQAEYRDASVRGAGDVDGPRCATCGKATCPDAALPAFSEPRECTYAPIYHALRRSKDCDYGCARDYTNQAVRLWVVEAVEKILAARGAEQRRLGREEGAEAVVAAVVEAHGVDRGVDDSCPWLIQFCPEVLAARAAAQQVSER